MRKIITNQIKNSNKDNIMHIKLHRERKVKPKYFLNFKFFLNIFEL